MEIPPPKTKASATTRRSPQGECGLKCKPAAVDETAEGRSPQGECGLKFGGEAEALHGLEVAPRKGSVD